VTEIPYYKWRCKKCRKEAKNVTYHNGKFLKIGECECKGPRTLEIVPMTKANYEARFKNAASQKTA
jgi:hypothetical protein